MLLKSNLYHCLFKTLSQHFNISHVLISSQYETHCTAKYTCLQCFKALKSIKFHTICICNKKQIPQLTDLKFAQSWTALFLAFSSHQQPSASLTKLIPSWTRRLDVKLFG